MKLLIGGSSSKMFHLKEFSDMLKKNNVEVKLVLDVEYADGFPSRKMSNWFTSDTKFNTKSRYDSTENPVYYRQT